MRFPVQTDHSFLLIEEMSMAKLILNVFADGLHGKAGNAVFVRGKSGVYLRSYTVPRDPRTASQSAIRSHFAKAVSAFQGLTPAQAAQWRTYAQTQFKVDIRDGTARQMSGYSVFVALAGKFLQVKPNSPVPLNPPAFGFVGDSIFVVAAGGSGVVTFTASGPNSFSVRAELLLQRLPRAAHTPKPRGYRTQLFAGFVVSPFNTNVTAAPGYYVPAYRFVNTLTGQSTELIVLPVVQVS